jgi:ribose 5-phosphate isomerase
VITDGGNLVLDWVFPTDAKLDWKNVDDFIRKIPGQSTGLTWWHYNFLFFFFPGVVETGIFVGLAKAAYFGHDKVP